MRLYGSDVFSFFEGWSEGSCVKNLMAIFLAFNFRGWSVGNHLLSDNLMVPCMSPVFD